MDRFDYYDITPKGMDAYMASHGRHFSKPMLEWAVGMMKDRNGINQSAPDRKKVMEKLNSNGVDIERDKGYYDVVYVWCMAKSDYLGSSIRDEEQLSMFVKDFIDDKDNHSDTKAFDHFYIDCIANGIDIPWADVI